MTRTWVGNRLEDMTTDHLVNALSVVERRLGTIEELEQDDLIPAGMGDETAYWVKAFRDELKRRRGPSPVWLSSKKRARRFRDKAEARRVLKDVWDLCPWNLLRRLSRAAG